MDENKHRPTSWRGTSPDVDSDDLPFELTPKDKYILELNHQRLSYRKISQRLKLDHSIELSKSAISRRLKELRQDPANDVQIQECSIPQKPREECKWYKIIERVRQAIIEYTKLNGFKPSSRTMFYQMQDEGLVTKNEQSAFVKATVEARLGWVDPDGELYYPKLDIDCFADDDSRKSVGYYDNGEPTDPTAPGPIPDPDDEIGWLIRMLKAAPNKYTGRGSEGEPGRAGGRWYNQPEYVEVWEEKVDLLQGFEKLLEGKCVRIRANKGFPSLVFLNQCCVELKKVIEEVGFDPEDIHIKYAGDWDPSGEGMVYYIKKRLRQLGIEGVNVERIAVLPEQITEYNLPLMPIEPENGKKPDPNLHEFKRRYGDKATHLNAFFIKEHIGAFKKILIESIDKHWDKSIYNDMIEEYEEAEPEEPEKLDENKLRETRKNMCKKITEAFAPGWYDYLVEEGNQDKEQDNDDE